MSHHAKAVPLIRLKGDGGAGEPARIAGYLVTPGFFEGAQEAVREGPVLVQVVPEHVVCVSTFCPLSVFVWDVPSMFVVWVTVQFPSVVQSPWMRFVWLFPVSLSWFEVCVTVKMSPPLPVWTESPPPFRIGPNCLCVNEYPGGSGVAM